MSVYQLQVATWRRPLEQPEPCAALRARVWRMLRPRGHLRDPWLALCAVFEGPAHCTWPRTRPRRPYSHLDIRMVNQGRYVYPNSKTQPLDNQSAHLALETSHHLPTPTCMTDQGPGRTDSPASAIAHALGPWKAGQLGTMLA